MRVVLQRVKNASVTVSGETISEIGEGLLLLVGVAKDDGEGEASWLAEKIAGLRIFNDEDGKMNLGVRDVGGEILAVSQFTLLADTRKGKRPSFIQAALPEEAEPLFDYFCERLREAGIASVQTGSFGAMMDVALVNDGPVTIVLER
ncbi:MAG: D-aminoacyl-tRNA deacylase [Actinomycetota bacterium]|nr:D-aminoacyl-tRNA deacylase [Actinomycetota bacterium]MDQ5810412.1 D-aminoacyl-tRNA deacylase [Actinomycetota bacterium]MDQ5818762.1 D-aminoacyl-tRNA deacylase [Actinomycetota bacterium]MDQ5828402.1 D-aminoacyl-tRNA deacylase [Actinomycetota bacterium]